MTKLTVYLKLRCRETLSDFVMLPRAFCVATMQTSSPPSPQSTASSTSSRSSSPLSLPAAGRVPPLAAGMRTVSGTPSATADATAREKQEFEFPFAWLLCGLDRKGNAEGTVSSEAQSPFAWLLCGLDRRDKRVAPAAAPRPASASQIVSVRIERVPVDVSTIVKKLKVTTGEMLQRNLLSELADRVTNASGDAVVTLCDELRECGAVAIISNLLTHESAQIHQLAIHLVGNLAHLTSVAVDRGHADLIRRELKQAGAFDLLLPYLFSTDEDTLLYTVVAIQNMCVDIECVEKLKAAGGIKMLQDIVRQEGPGRSICCVKTFAHSCLDNARTAVVIYALQQKVLKTRKPKTQAEAGMVLARAYIRGWRARRAEAAKVNGIAALAPAQTTSRKLF